MLSGGESYTLSYGSRRHAAYAQTCQTSMDCTAKWLKGERRVAAGSWQRDAYRVGESRVQLLERRTTAGRQPRRVSSFQIVSSCDAKRPAWHSAQAGRGLAPLAGPMRALKECILWVEPLRGTCVSNAARLPAASFGLPADPRRTPSSRHSRRARLRRAYRWIVCGRVRTSEKRWLLVRWGP